MRIATYNVEWFTNPFDGKGRLIGVHVKSRAPHGADSPAEVMRYAIENRRKQLAQCIWLRQRVAGHLEAGETLIVLGDFNGGPGLDEYEKLFGGFDVEIVLGENGATRIYAPHDRMALVPAGRRDAGHRAVLSALEVTLSSGAAGLRHGLANPAAPRPALAPLAPVR